MLLNNEKHFWWRRYNHFSKSGNSKNYTFCLAIIPVLLSPKTEFIISPVSFQAFTWRLLQTLHPPPNTTNFTAQITPPITGFDCSCVTIKLESPPARRRVTSDPPPLKFPSRKSATAAPLITQLATKKTSYESGAAVVPSAFRKCASAFRCGRYFGHERRRWTGNGRFWRCSFEPLRHNLLTWKPWLLNEIAGYVRLLAVVHVIFLSLFWMG